MMVRGSNKRRISVRLGTTGRTAPAAAPGAPARPAALGIAATIVGCCEDSVNAGRGRAECGGVAVGRCPSGRTAEERPVVRNLAPRRAGGEEAGPPRPPDTGIAGLVGSDALQVGQTGAEQIGAAGAGGRRDSNRMLYAIRWKRIMSLTRWSWDCYTLTAGCV